MRGRPGLKETQRLAINATATAFAVAEELLQVDLDTRVRLLERFEEMSRRQRIDVTSIMRPGILELLVTELWANQQALKTSAGDLVPVTAYCGAIGPKLSTEFPDFSDTPGIFKTAAVHYPSDPSGFLRRVQGTIAELAAGEEFVALRDAPGIFKYAAVNYPADPRSFLRGVKKIISELAADDEFAAFRDTPGIFKQAVMNNPANPRGFLRGVQDTIAALAADDEFAAFRDTPSIFKYAAVGNPTDPRAWLLGVQATIAALVTDDEFAALRHTLGIFTRAAVGYSSDPRSFLRSKLQSSERYANSVKQRRMKPPSTEQER